MWLFKIKPEFPGILVALALNLLWNYSKLLQLGLALLLGVEGRTVFGALLQSKELGLEPFFLADPQKDFLLTLDWLQSQSELLRVLFDLLLILLLRLHGLRSHFECLSLLLRS